jgi:hypothetical protein
MSFPRRPPFGHDCPPENTQNPAARQRSQRPGNAQRATQRLIVRNPVANTRPVQHIPSPSSARPRAQHPTATRTSRIAKFSDIGGLGGEQQEDGYLVGGQGDVAVGDRGIGDYRPFVPAPPLQPQPVGNFGTTGRTLDGRRIAPQSQTSTAPVEQSALGAPICRPAAKAGNQNVQQNTQKANTSTGGRQALQAQDSMPNELQQVRFVQ